MTISSTTLVRAAGIAAALAGLIFIGVQIGHPHLDASTVTTTEVVVRNSFKTLMAVLALIGFTGMYLHRVRKNGVLGLIGYVVLAAGYLAIISTTVIATHVLPAIAGTDPAYVNDVITLAKGGSPAGDVGGLRYVQQVQDLGYLAGGLVFGIALFRAGVLARWATLLLAAGGLVTLVLSLLPDAFYRLLALPNGIAMIGLGVSLWSVARTADRQLVSA